jgi:hypothetical protein
MPIRPRSGCLGATDERNAVERSKNIVGQRAVRVGLLRYARAVETSERSSPVLSLQIIPEYSVTCIEIRSALRSRASFNPF